MTSLETLTNELAETKASVATLAKTAGDGMDAIVAKLSATVAKLNESVTPEQMTAIVAEFDVIQKDAADLSAALKAKSDAVV